MNSALIIGAGLGGLATAARLARAGYRVTVLESGDSETGSELPGLPHHPQSAAQATRPWTKWIVGQGQWRA